jgi:hypothetical protein
MVIAATELVIETLVHAGGQATRTAVLAAVAYRYGRREATSAVGMACISGRVTRTILSDGILGLRLVSDETEDLDGQMLLSDETARPGLASAVKRDAGARRLSSVAAGAESQQEHTA